jgi:predicted phosphate transport protein (TIGR00153 family)
MRFFDLFEDASVNMVESAKLLLDLMEHFEGVEAKARAIKDVEHRADTVTHEIMNELRKTFIPPLEREDVAALAESLDDVVDYIEDAAARMVLYKVSEPTPTARELARIILRVTEEIQRTLPLLRNRDDMKRVLRATVEINRMENEADDVARQGLMQLFDRPDDVLHVIKWREIYEVLEGATDRAEDVANVLEGVVLKHS